MDLKPPDGEIDSSTAKSNCSSLAFSSPVNSSLPMVNPALSAEINMVEALIQTSVDASPSDGELFDVPPATTNQFAMGNLLSVASSMPNDLTAVVEASSPLEILDIAKAPAFDEKSERETAFDNVEELSSDSPTAFVPSLGAWAKPLTFAPPVTPPTPATPMDFDPQYLNNLLDSFWPTLIDGVGKNQKKRSTNCCKRVSMCSGSKDSGPRA